MIDTSEFDKTKIYEELDHFEAPANYQGKIPWKVQCQIAATNGIHYVDSIGKLNEYPVPEIPIGRAATGQELLLDIGCGWGRWVTAAGLKNYIPVGIDIRLEFCGTAREVMNANGVKGYSVTADLQKLPFKDGIFDVVWSFSVIQHTHKTRLLNCIGHIHRILRQGSFAKLEFPNKNGLRNRFGPVPQAEKNRDDINSWDVRYYTPSEYRNIFEPLFKNFRFENHSFFGIGVLKEDIKYTTSLKNKAISAISLFFSGIAAILKPMKYLSDSIYVIVQKKENTLNNEQSVKTFLNLHAARPGDNLNLLPLLACPISGGGLSLDSSGDWLISEKAGKKFPIVNDTPILIASEGVNL